MKITKSLLAAFFVYLLINTGISFCQTDNPKNLDIAILEDVLDKVMNNKTSNFGWSAETSGFYLNGFGYLFKASANRLFLSEPSKVAEFQMQNLSNMREKLKKTRENVDSLRVILDEFKYKNAKSSQKTDSAYSNLIEDIKQNVSDFLLRYASTLTPSFSGEKISVLIDLDNYSFRKNQSSSLAAWALVSDLNKHMGGTSVGKKLIHFSMSDKKDYRKNKQIEIFQEILNKTIPGLGHNSSSTYYKGVGAIFFLNIMSSPSEGLYSKSISLIYKNKRTENSDVYIPYTIEPKPENNGKKSSEKSRQLLINKYKDNVINAIVKYGHTIDLNQNESVIVVTNINTTFSFIRKSQPPKIIIQASRKDINDFSSGKITKKILKNKIKITEN